MANINAHLPSAIAVPFHPPTENLQHDNSIKPVIPKTEVISSYSKFRDTQERAQFTSQLRNIVQDESQSAADNTDKEQQNAGSEQRRFQFFMRRGGKLTSESEFKQLSDPSLEDFKQVISVIATRYNSAVSPLPEPTVNLAI